MTEIEESTELTEWTELSAILTAELEQREGKDKHALQEWYLGRLASIEARRDLVKAGAASMQIRLDTEEAALVWKFGQLFQDKVLEDLDKQPGKSRSVQYLLGKAGLRKQPGGLMVVDDQKALEWADAGGCPAAVKTVKSLLKTPLNETWQATGLIPPGCVLTEAKDKFYPVSDIRELPKSVVKRLLEAYQRQLEDQAGADRARRILKEMGM